MPAPLLPRHRSVNPAPRRHTDFEQALGYSRASFGPTWFDADRNGCDTRNDILRPDLVDRTMKNPCKVLAGTAAPDPYAGTQIRFVSGGFDEIDVGHVVSVPATDTP